MKPVYELAQVVSLFKTAFTERHPPLDHHLSVLYAIEQCRTAAMGGHVDACDQCGHLRSNRIHDLMVPDHAIEVADRIVGEGIDGSV